MIIETISQSNDWSAKEAEDIGCRSIRGPITSLICAKFGKVSSLSFAPDSSLHLKSKYSRWQ